MKDKKKKKGKKVLQFQIVWKIQLISLWSSYNSLWKLEKSHTTPSFPIRVVLVQVNHSSRDFIVSPSLYRAHIASKNVATSLVTVCPRWNTAFFCSFINAIFYNLLFVYMCIVHIVKNLSTVLKQKYDFKEANFWRLQCPSTVKKELVIKP